MNSRGPLPDTFWPLLDSACDGTLVESQRQELAALLNSDLTARKIFVDHIELWTTIRMLVRAERACDTGLDQVKATFSQTPSFSSTATTPSLLLTTLHNTVNFFSQELPFSLLIATLLTGFGLWIASLVYVSGPEKIAKNSSPPVQSSFDPTLEVVGKITGMVDVKWSDSNTSTETGNGVSLGRKYALESGLIEITYGTGAKVILQGPVTYEVESKNGGFLPVGKLTGKVEAETAKGFAVRTPTAVVTDLGTEFGVAVDKAGATTSHVFRGAVQVRAVSSDGKPEGKTVVLRRNQSARVESRDGSRKVDDRVTLIVSPSERSSFVREMPKLTVKTFDLVDVVAGGDGFSGKRNAGIDVATGIFGDVAPDDRPSSFGDGKYHRVRGMSFVDGVFIPKGGDVEVQVDSAGHVFADCPTTSNVTAHYVWAGGAIPTRGVPVSTILGGIDYAAKGRGLLFLHPNKGITFDLEAIRKANSGYVIQRFRGVAGISEQADGTSLGFADIWVLIDGQLRFRRWQINAASGAFTLDIPIKRNERFLTLISTDAGNGIASDWVVFGDPRLEMIVIDNEKSTKNAADVAAGNRR